MIDHDRLPFLSCCPIGFLLHGGLDLALAVCAADLYVVFGHVRVVDQVLDGQTLARIWAGEITTWDNEAIKSLNPTVATKLPATDILLTFAPNNVTLAS